MLLLAGQSRNEFSAAVLELSCVIITAENFPLKLNKRWHKPTVHGRGKAAPVHTTEVHGGSRFTVRLFVPSAQYDCGGSTSLLGRLIPDVEPRNPLNRILNGAQSRYGQFWRKQNLLPLPGFKLQTVQLVAASYTEYVISAIESNTEVGEFRGCTCTKWGLGWRSS
jgi:hypothetical protein